MRCTDGERRGDADSPCRIFSCVLWRRPEEIQDADHRADVPGRRPVGCPPQAPTTSVASVQHDEPEGHCLGNVLYRAQPVGRQNSVPRKNPSVSYGRRR
jgi:hypothetical protein